MMKIYKKYISSCKKTKGIASSHFMINAAGIQLLRKYENYEFEANLGGTLNSSDVLTTWQDSISINH